jgi:hypothetical protein
MRNQAVRTKPRPRQDSGILVVGGVDPMRYVRARATRGIAREVHQLIDKLVSDLGLPPDPSPARVLRESERAQSKCPRLRRSNRPLDLNERRWLSAALLYLVMTDVAAYEHPDPNSEINEWRIPQTRS